MIVEGIFDPVYYYVMKCLNAAPGMNEYILYEE